MDVDAGGDVPPSPADAPSGGRDVANGATGGGGGADGGADADDAMRDVDDGDLFDGGGGGSGDDGFSGGDWVPASPVADALEATGSSGAVTTSPLIGPEGKRYLYDCLASSDLDPKSFVTAFQATHSLPPWTKPALDLITASGLSQADAHQKVVAYMVDKMVATIAVSAGGGGSAGHRASGGGTPLPPVSHESMVALLVASFPHLSTPHLAPVPTALLVHLPDPPEELLLELAASAPAKPPYVGLPLDVKRKVWDAQGSWSAAFDADASAAIDAFLVVPSYGGRGPDGRVHSISDANGPDDWTPPPPGPTAYLRAAVGDSPDRYGQLADALVDRYAEASAPPAGPAVRRGNGSGIGSGGGEYGSLLVALTVAIAAGSAVAVHPEGEVLAVASGLDAAARRRELTPATAVGLAEITRRPLAGETAARVATCLAAPVATGLIAAAVLARVTALVAAQPRRPPRLLGVGGAAGTAAGGGGQDVEELPPADAAVARAMAAAGRDAGLAALLHLAAAVAAARVSVARKKLVTDAAAAAALADLPATLARLIADDAARFGPGATDDAGGGGPAGGRPGGAPGGPGGGGAGWGAPAAAAVAVADDADLPDAAIGRVIAAGGVAAATVMLYALGRWRAGDVVGFFRLRAAVSDTFVAAGGAVGWLGSTADVLLDVLDEWDHDVLD